MSETKKIKITNEKFFVTHIPKNEETLKRLCKFLGDEKNWTDVEFKRWVEISKNNYIFYLNEYKEYTFFIDKPFVPTSLDGLIEITYFELMEHYLPVDFPFEIGEIVTDMGRGDVEVIGYEWLGEYEDYFITILVDNRASVAVQKNNLIGKQKGEVVMPKAITIDTPVGTRVSHRGINSEHIIEEVNNSKYKYLAVKFKGILGYFNALDYEIIGKDEITLNTPIGTKVARRDGEIEEEIVRIWDNEEVGETGLLLELKGHKNRVFNASDYSIVDSEDNPKEAIKYPDFSRACVGDVVYCPRRGQGTITFIKMTSVTPLTVEFKIPDDEEHINHRIKRSYTLQGKVREKDLHPSIFWQPIPIPDEAYVRPLPKLEVDTLVWVWSSSGIRRVRFFKSFTNDGKILAFDDGYDSKATTFVTEWDNWELYEPKGNK